MVNKKPEELWITNISREKDISLGDLRLTIRIGESINLLSTNKKGKPRYNFTKKQINDSISFGSIFKKSNVIKIRKIAPVVFNHRIDIAKNSGRNSARIKRKPTKIENVEYPDLDWDEMSQEEFAAENADMEFADRKPLLAVDPKFKNTSGDDE